MGLVQQKHANYLPTKLPQCQLRVGTSLPCSIACSGLNLLLNLPPKRAHADSCFAAYTCLEDPQWSWQAAIPHSAIQHNYDWSAISAGSRCLPALATGALCSSLPLASAIPKGSLPEDRQPRGWEIWIEGTGLPNTGEQEWGLVKAYLVGQGIQGQRKVVEVGSWRDRNDDPVVEKAA